MSLTSFIARSDVTARIKPLRPKIPRKIDALLKVEPRTKHYTMVGTAFDYLLRFELQRQAPHASVKPWVAEAVPDLIWPETQKSGFGGFGDPTQKDRRPPNEVAQSARNIIKEAKGAVAAYVKSKVPNRAKQEEIARHAIRLAKLDPVYRAGSRQLDPQFESADPEDIQDLLALLAIVPFDALLDKQVMLLNPNFGESSGLVGGADADLITGDMLVDFKTTKSNEIKVTSLDQLLGYFLLARNERGIDPKFPDIKKLGLYFCRHGYLLAVDTVNWTDHPQFPEVEKWFFKHAKEVFVPRQQKD